MSQASENTPSSYLQKLLGQKNQLAAQLFLFTDLNNVLEDVNSTATIFLPTQQALRAGLQRLGFDPEAFEKGSGKHNPGDRGSIRISGMTAGLLRAHLMAHVIPGHAVPMSKVHDMGPMRTMLPGQLVEGFRK